MHFMAAQETQNLSKVGQRTKSGGQSSRMVGASGTTSRREL